MNRPEILALFARQHWGASWRQAADLGVGRSALSRARQQVLVRSPVRGVVAVAGVELSFAGRALCAQLAAGGSAFVSGPTAGVLHGLRDTPRRRIEVTIEEHPPVLATGELIHLDLAWIDVRMAVEPGHSWWHGGDLGQRRDQARDRPCGVVGWHVSRYDETAPQDWMGTARELLALYRRRRADLGGSAETSSR